MAITPTDRRGLGEIVTWATVVGALSLINVIYIVASVSHGGTIQIDKTLMGILGGAVTALIARGTQGAAERSGSSQSMDQAAAELRRVTEEHRALIAAANQTAMMAHYNTLQNLQSMYPAGPPTPAPPSSPGEKP